MKSSSLKHFALGCASILAVSALPAEAASTKYPLTIETCGKSVTFDAAPASTVTVGQSSTEIMYLLGLAEKVKGTSVWFTSVLPQFKEVNDKIERLADIDPSFEAVVGKKPELVLSQFAWHVGPEGLVATPDQLADVGIKSYISPTDCAPDGTKKPKFSPELIYKEITELATIFDVQDRGAELVAELKDRVENAKKKVSGIKGKGLKAVFWFSSADVEMDPYVAGRGYAADYIMETLGITNVIESDKQWPTVGWEAIAKADPDVVVMGRMVRRRFPADDWEVKADFLKNDAVTSLMPAIEKGHMIPMDAHAMDPTVRTLFGIEELADALVKFGLVK